MLHLVVSTPPGCEMETCQREHFTSVKTNSYKCRKRRRLPQLVSMALASLVSLVFLVPAHCQRVQVTEFNQTVITDKVIFSLDQSPYLITDDVIVQRTGTSSRGLQHKALYSRK
jgi:hypothetical protein